MNNLSAAIAISLFIITCGIAVDTGACAAPSPSAKAGRELEEHAAKLLKCRSEGREAGTYSAYEACKKDAGVE